MQAGVGCLQTCFGALVDIQRLVAAQLATRAGLVRYRRTREVKQQGAREGLARFPQSAEFSLAWHRR